MLPYSSAHSPVTGLTLCLAQPVNAWFIHYISRVAYAFGFRGMELGIVLLLAISTAAASYVMVRNLGGDYRLAAVSSQ